MKVKLQDIIDALEMVSIERDSYYNKETGDIFFSDIGEYIEITEDELDELFEQSIMLPTKYEINEYSMMEEFIEKINNPVIYNRLLSEIQGKRAFRYFKDACIDFGIINDWYQFRNEKYKEIAIKWCKDYNISYDI